MAFFDPVQQRMCVRIVYDGVSHAGKTTNLKQLSTLFGTQRTVDLQSPGEIDGRTIYFDWVQIVAGVVCGFALTCEVLSVPGHVVLSPRRRHLLREADAVVYVCDSAEDQLERARTGLSILREMSEKRPRPIPIIVQANKQDQPDALAGAEVLRRIGFHEVPVVEAIATEGIGVVDTFVGAVRSVSREMQARMEAAPLSIEVRRSLSRTEVFDALSREAIDPEWAAELCLEMALAQMQMEAALGQRSPRVAPPRQSVRKLAPPPLPTEDVPTGFIWPAHTGRATLKRLAGRGGEPAAPHLARAAAPSDAGGVTMLKVDGHVLRTSPAQRFEDREAARQALVRAARERTQLENLLVPETVLVVCEASDGASWIWTVMPALVTVGDRLKSAEAASAHDVMKTYAEGVADAVAVRARRGLKLSLSPESCGVDSGVARYVGDIQATGESEPDDGIASVVDALRALGGDPAQFQDVFDRRFALRAGAEQSGP